MKSTRQPTKRQEFCFEVLKNQTDSCVVWPFKPNKAGYYCLDFEGKTQFADCVICELVHGPRPNLHYKIKFSCETENCVNPQHMMWGLNDSLTFVYEAAESNTKQCIFWPFGLEKSGYAVIRQPDGTKTTAHRFVCVLAHGDPPTPKHHAAHKCKNRGCVNPKHLEWKTAKENMLDKIRDGTEQTGERHGLSKLTDDQALEIIARYRPRIVTLKMLAEEFGVVESTISKIVRRDAWRHL